MALKKWREKLNIYNQELIKKYVPGWVDGWVDGCMERSKSYGWMDVWRGVKAILRTAYSNQE